jgi:dihydroorotate dehydrogenase (subfamily 1) family protein
VMKIFCHRLSLLKLIVLRMSQVQPIEEYIGVCRIFDQSNIHAIELNISCPNVKKGGMEFGNDPEMSAQVVEACKGVTSKPIITKLSPNQADIKESARKCIDAGSDALSVINTITGMAIDIESKRPVLGNTSGGLSGPAIKPIALQKVMQVYEVAGPQNIPIMGQGGISSVEDALEFIIAGASTVGIGTALFIDPLVCNKINKGLEKYLTDHGLNCLEDLVGSLIKD